MIHEPDSVALVVPLAAKALFDTALPEDEGLHPGDTGVVVDAMHAPAVFTVEFFRDGETVAVADVTPDQIRLLEHRLPESVAPRQTAD